MEAPDQFRVYSDRHSGFVSASNSLADSWVGGWVVVTMRFPVPDPTASVFVHHQTHQAVACGNHACAGVPGPLPLLAAATGLAELHQVGTRIEGETGHALAGTASSSSAGRRPVVIRASVVSKSIPRSGPGCA